MDKIEKIRQEIERLKTIQLKRIQEGDLVDAEPYDKNEAYNELLDFLDTLSEEPDKSLEEAAKEYAEGIVQREDALMCKQAFIEGAEWQKERGTFMGPIHEKCSQCPYDRDVIFWKGMQYAIKGMKEDAVDGIYTKSMDGKNVFVESGALKIDPASVKVGDSVKLIIIKDDGKSD